VAVLDGLKEILLSADPGIGIDPDAGYIFKWIEKVGLDHVYKGKDENGVVFDIGTSGSAPTFGWMLHAGMKDLKTNVTNDTFGYALKEANKGLIMHNDGVIKSMSAKLTSITTAGDAIFIISINGVDNNVVGQRLVIEPTSTTEGGINSTDGFILFTSELAYLAGDTIEVKCLNTGHLPDRNDGSVIVRMEDTV